MQQRKCFIFLMWAGYYEQKINYTWPKQQHTSAIVCFVKNVEGSDPGTGSITTSAFFKSCTIISQNNVNRKLELSFPNWPICITVDGFATIAASVDILSDEISILSFNVCCSAHVPHCIMKQKAGPKTVYKRLRNMLFKHGLF